MWHFPDFILSVFLTPYLPSLLVCTTDRIFFSRLWLLSDLADNTRSLPVLDV